ncbi:MAG: TIGR04086 family membrane protein [Lachnospiraceae bacterium]
MRSKLIPVIRTLLLSFLISIIILCLMALLMWKLSLSDGQVKTGLYLSYLLSCLFGGFCFGHIFPKRRILWGLCFGIGYFILLALVCVVVAKATLSYPAFLVLGFAASEDALDHSLVSLSRSIFHSDTTYV